MRDGYPYVSMGLKGRESGMDESATAVAEKLACEFRAYSPRTVARVVVECVVEFPEGDFMLIEQAARARLSGPAHEEVELTTELMLAANESPVRLERQAIDAILGVVPPAGALRGP